MISGLGKILGEIDIALSHVDAMSQEVLINKIVKSKRVFLTGCGRSGLVLKTFAMRLMQIGIDVHFVGETTTPAIEKGDLLIIASASGESKQLIIAAQIAARLKAQVLLITASPASSAAKLSEYLIEIPAPTKTANSNNNLSFQPMGTLFEQCLMILMDCTVLGIMKLTNTTADGMYSKHANLE